MFLSQKGKGSLGIQPLGRLGKEFQEFQTPPGGAMGSNLSMYLEESIFHSIELKGHSRPILFCRSIIIIVYYDISWAFSAFMDSTAG